MSEHVSGASYLNDFAIYMSTKGNGTKDFFLMSVTARQVMMK